MVSFFKFFSLLSATLSVIVYFLPIRELGLKADYFLILHLTSMISFGGMILHSWKTSKKVKPKFSLINLLNNYKTLLSKLKILYKQNRTQVQISTICSVIIFIFLQYHALYFISEVGSNHVENHGTTRFVELGAGHWIIFSSIPTLYFFYGIPLKKAWEKI